MHEASSWATKLIVMVCISIKLRSRPSYIIVKQKANILNTEVYTINTECEFGKREVLFFKVHISFQNIYDLITYFPVTYLSILSNKNSSIF